MEENGIKKEENGIKREETSNKSKTGDIAIKSNEIKKEKMPKRVVVSIDNTYEDVIQYQHEGYSIFFSDEKGQLLELTTEQRKKLNPFNAKKYEVAKSIVEGTLDLTSIKTSHMKFEPKATFASATNRLRIENGKPGMHYAWKRQDELQMCMYEGFKICQDPNVKTFGMFDEDGSSLEGSTHYVKANGEIELVLMEIPQERADARRKAIEDLSKKRNAAVDEAIKAELEALGGDPEGVARRFDK